MALSYTTRKSSSREIRQDISITRASQHLYFPGNVDKYTQNTIYFPLFSLGHLIVRLVREHHLAAILQAGATSHSLNLTLLSSLPTIRIRLAPCIIEIYIFSRRRHRIYIYLQSGRRSIENKRFERRSQLALRSRSSRGIWLQTTRLFLPFFLGGN